jgi:restriction system protein
MRDLIVQIADDLGLSQDEREQKLQGGEKIIASRVHWAKTYLKQAGLIDQPKRAIVQITQRGRDVLGQNPKQIDRGLLQQFDEFKEFLTKTRVSSAATDETVGSRKEMIPPSITPEEQITSASNELDASMRDALLARILEASPNSF